MRIDTGIPIELLDDALCLNFRALRKIDKLLRDSSVRGFCRYHVVHRLSRKTGRWQRELDVRAHLPVGLPRVEHVDPNRTHRDLTAIQHVERSRVARRHHDVLIEIFETGERFVDRRFLCRVVRAFFKLVAHPAIGSDPTHDEADAGHAALHTVVAELFWILLHPFVQLDKRFRRCLDEIGVVGKSDLAVEHRQHIAVDVRAERVFRGIARHQLAGRDVVAVGHQQLFIDHRRCAALVHDGHVDIPRGRAGFLLGG